MSAIPPTIPGSIDIKTISTGNICFKGTNYDNVGFYGQTPSDQQDQPTLPVNITSETNYVLIQDLINTLTLYGLYKPITAIPPSGRSITFTNNSTNVLDVTVYLTVGAPNAEPPTIIATLAHSASFVWPIPEVVNWSGNFQFWQDGYGPAPGSTLIEMGLNQKWKGIEDLRDTFDISTVPPGIGNLFANGPRDAAVAYSAAQGFTIQQSRGYSVGLQIIPPAAPVNPPISLPTLTVTVNVLTGNSADAITYPNDTAYPKQQTGYAQGSYQVNIIDPTDIDIPAN
jgi:hypothetical protein